MRFQIPSDRFAVAVQAASYAAGSGTRSIEILRGSHWKAEAGKLSVSCTDMGAFSTATVDADVSEPGAMVVSMPTAAQLKTLKALSGETVTLETDGEVTTLVAGSTRCTLKTAPVEYYPVVPVLGDAVALDAAGFAGVLASVLPSAGTDESRPVLFGVGFQASGGVLTCAATDSYRLRVKTMADVLLADTMREGTAGPIILPASGLGILAKYLKAKGVEAFNVAEVKDNPTRTGFEVFSKGLDVTLTLRHIDGAFPNWRQLIPDAWPIVVDVPREPLIDSLQRVVALTATKYAQVVRVTLAPGGVLGLRMENVRDGIEATDTLQCSGLNAHKLPLPIEVGVNPGYLVDGLKSFSEETVRLNAINPLRPLLLTGAAHESAQQAKTPTMDCYLVMPVRLA